MNEKIKEQIEEMENLINAVTVTPATDPVATDPPGTEAPGTDLPATSAPATTAPATAAPDADDVEGGEPLAPSPELSSTAEVAALRAELEELRALLKQKPSTNAPATSAPPEDFLAEFDFEDVTSDKDEFNKLLNKIYSKATKAAEAKLSALPEIIRTNIDSYTQVQKATEEFYSSNSDLEPFKKVVGLVFGELSSANPNKPYPEVLKEVATETRKRLNLPNPTAKPAVQADSNPPRLPRKAAQPRPKQSPKPDPFQSEIEAMENALNS
jgi:hypothetical protein